MMNTEEEIRAAAASKLSMVLAALSVLRDDGGKGRRSWEKVAEILETDAGTVRRWAKGRGLPTRARLERLLDKASEWKAEMSRRGRAQK